MNRRVLYVDDEPDNLVVFEVGFEDDFEVHTANSGAEALELLEEMPFAVVVADQRMPAMTGVELFEIVRERYPFTKRILLTGYSDPDSMVDAINKGQVFHYVRKPFERHDLFAILLRAVETYELERANSHLTNRLVADDRSATLGRMTAKIAHEIGNQLCLLPLIESIETEYGEVEDLATFGRLARQVFERLSALIDEVKRFMRFEHEEFVQHPVHLATTVRELVAFLRFDERIPSDSITIRSGHDPVVLGNKLKLQQVLVNLIRNAADAIAHNEDGRILIEIAHRDDTASVTVTDNGCGIAEDVVRRIWEPFFTTKGESGNGIGLDISRQIVEAHGGRIECNSTVGEGAMFVMSLPRHEVEHAESAEAEPVAHR